METETVWQCTQLFTSLPETCAATTNTTTNVPTIANIDELTNTPTNVPTNAPTNAPDAPTDTPNEVPTDLPTDAPTNAPTNTPTKKAEDPSSFSTSVTTIEVFKYHSSISNVILSIPSKVFSQLDTSQNSINQLNATIAGRISFWISTTQTAVPVWGCPSRGVRTTIGSLRSTTRARISHQTRLSIQGLLLVHKRMIKTWNFQIAKTWHVRLGKFSPSGILSLATATFIVVCAFTTHVHRF